MFAQSSTPGGTLKIVVQPMFGDEPLKLETKTYVNAHGDSLNIDEFRFYVSRIIFSGTGISTVEKESYHLIDAEDKTTQTIYIKNVAAGNYAKINFIIGVDSMANVSGANGGDLDPVKAMYWAWNTGYIMAKMQGRSGVCKTLHHAFEFHIGGYLPPYNAARNVNLQVTGLNVEAGKETTVYIKADAAAWFANPETIDLSKVNEVNMPCKAAMMMADNYSDMFSVVRVR